MNCDLTLLSKYRTQLMGFAMIWIMLIHSYGELETYPSSIKDFILLFISFGYGGVDMFLLLSGIGLYYSWIKKPDISFFYKQRLVRILPLYFTITFFISLYEIIYRNYELSHIVNSLFFIDFFQNKINLTFAWYIPCILIFYAVTPILLKYIPTSKFKIYIPVIIIATITFSKITDVQGVYYLILSRFPIFLIGLYGGYIILSSKKISKTYTYLGLFLLIAITFYLYLHFDVFLTKPHGFYYIFIIIAPAVSIALSYIFTYLPQYNYPILVYFGSYSLTIYLLHEKILYLLLFYLKTLSESTIIITAIIITIIIAKPIQDTINGLVKYISSLFPRAVKLQSAENIYNTNK